MDIQEAINRIVAARHTLEELQSAVADQDKPLIDEKSRALQQQLANLLEILRQTQDASPGSTHHNT